MDKAIEFIDFLSSPIDHHSDAAKALWIIVGGFEINRCEIFHIIRLVSKRSTHIDRFIQSLFDKGKRESAYLQRNLEKSALMQGLSAMKQKF